MAESNAAKLSGYAFGAGFVIVAIWAWFLVENYLGIDIKGRELSRDDTPLAIWVPLVTMPASIAVAGYAYWRAKRLVANGVEIAAEIISVGKIGVQGLRDIKFRYMVGEKSYEKKTSVSKDYAKSLEVGDTIMLIVNPNSPNTFLLQDH